MINMIDWNMKDMIDRHDGCDRYDRHDFVLLYLVRISL